MGDDVRPAARMRGAVEDGVAEQPDMSGHRSNQLKIGKPERELRGKIGHQRLGAGNIADALITLAAWLAMHSSEKCLGIDHPQLAHPEGRIDPRLAAETERE